MDEYEVIAISLTPYQGLKPKTHQKDNIDSKIAISLTPYQGLKREWMPKRDQDD